MLYAIAKADIQTTNNLVTNGNFETGNSNGWTTSGDVQVLNDCCELNNVASNYDLEFGDSGSITQDFNLSSDTITQNMLDNGITLNSTIEAQNGECSVTGCWGGQGDADTFTNELTIKDSDGNVLASNTNIRTDTTGIDGANFTDTLIYTGTGSNVGNINISASDGYGNQAYQVIKDEVQQFSDLPAVGINGMIVEVIGTAANSFINYYFWIYGIFFGL